MENNVMENMVPVEFANQRVLTYKQVAQGLKCSVDLLRMHFKNHPEQFEEGIHYFRLTGELLRNFRRQINEVYSPHQPLVGKFATCLLVWTCQGVARLSKLIDTPEAWELFTVLENNYFNPAPAAPPVEEPTIDAQVIAEIHQRLAELEKNFGGMQVVLAGFLEEARKNSTPLERAEKLIALAEQINDAESKDKVLLCAANLIVGKKLF